MATIYLDLSEVYDGLSRLHELTNNLSPVLLVIGEDLVESTKRRFETETDPAGYEWVGNSQLTIERKGFDKPLTGETGQLKNTIHWALNGNALAIGSPMEYAAVQQFGGTTEWQEYDEIWEVPERPFLGLSVKDREQISLTIGQQLRLAISGGGQNN